MNFNSFSHSKFIISQRKNERRWLNAHHYDFIDSYIKLWSKTHCKTVSRENVNLIQYTLYNNNNISNMYTVWSHVHSGYVHSSFMAVLTVWNEQMNVYTVQSIYYLLNYYSMNELLCCTIYSIGASLSISSPIFIIVVFLIVQWALVERIVNYSVVNTSVLL